MHKSEVIKNLVIVGNGMAAGKMVDELLAGGAKAKFSITVIGDEIHGSYNRIMLSSVLAGEATVPSIVHKNQQWYLENDIRFLPGVRVDRIDPERKLLLCSNDQTLAYDHVVMATGAKPTRIPAENQRLHNIMTFRTIDDVETILNLSMTARKAIVVGGGLLGLEAAYGMAVRGLDVVLVHRSHYLLNRQLDPASAAMLAEVMALKGVNFRLGCEVVRFFGSEKVEGAELDTGEVLPSDVVVIATGITPNAELGLDAGLAGKRGIDVSDYLETSDASISAIGECVEHRGQTFGLVEPIWQHCSVLAERLLNGTQNARFENMPVATKLKVSGVQVFSAGQWLTTEGVHEWVYSDESSKVYRKLLLKGGCIVGIVFFGDVRDGQYFFELMQERVKVTEFMPQLLMGRAFCENLPQNDVNVA